MSAPLVSIITVDYNGFDHTREFLSSLRKQTYKEVEVLVVDNGSKINYQEVCKRDFPEVKFIRSHENLGFAGGNNLGIERATGKYFFFINNDTLLKENLLEVMVARMESNASIGMLSPKIIYYPSDRIIQYAGYTKLHPVTSRNEAIGQKEKDSGQYDEFKEVAYGHGAAMMVSKEAIEKAGKMPEIFFLYYEELDWSESIKKAGYKICYEPKGEVYHKESMTVGKLNPMKVYYMNRNRILFMKRNSSVFQFFLFSIYFAFAVCSKNTIKYFFKGNFKFLISFWKAIFWNFSHS